MRPEDLEKFFEGKKPEWMNQEKEPETPSKPIPVPNEDGIRIQADAPEEDIPITAITGRARGYKFFVFYRTGAPTALTDPEAGFDLVPAEEEFLDRHEGFEKHRVRPLGIRFEMSGTVKSGTILKLFMGREIKLPNQWGAQYFIVGSLVGVKTFEHPHERNLYIRGRLRLLEPRELEEYELKIAHGSTWTAVESET